MTLNISLEECKIYFESKTNESSKIDHIQINKFEHLKEVQESTYLINEEDLEAACLSLDYKFLFKLKFKPNLVMLLACCSRADKEQWVRIFELINEMTRLLIDYS